jgi:alpha-1,6-mannosyltransferase
MPVTARARQPRLTLLALGCVLLGLTRFGLVLQRHDNLPGFIATALVQGIVYLAAVWMVSRIESKRSILFAILVIAGLLRLSIVFSPPYLSDDMYRYIWDGRVQAAGINPYRFVPADQQLAPLRDQSIYSHINRRDYAHTIYPPLAQAIFLGVTRISKTVTGMKMAMVGFEAIAIWLIIRLLTAWRLPPERVLIYAWHPLAIWEIAGSGHVEAVLVALIALALWSRSRDLRALTGAALAGAALIKLFPALLVAALYRRWDWKMPLAFAGTFLLAYLPYASVGSGAIGFLPVYLQEEGLVHGWGIFPLSVADRLLGLHGASGRAYLIFAMAVLATLALNLILRGEAVAYDRHVANALLLALTFTVLLSPHYAWYFLWLVPMLCFRLHVPALYLTLASFLLYELLLHTSGPVFFRVSVLLYLPFALIALVCWLVRRAQSESPAIQISVPEESRNATCVSK